MSSVRRVYSVCGHWKEEDKCPTKNNKSGLSRLLSRFGRAELPTRIGTVYLMGFCYCCRAAYNLEGSTLDLQYVILNYWAYKNWLGISDPVPPSRVPAAIVFAEPSSRLQHATNRRLEIVMLVNQLACTPFAGGVGELFHRLELVREKTLEWAASPPSPFSYSPGKSHILRREQQPRQVHEDTLSTLCEGQGQNETPTAEIEEERNTKVGHSDPGANLNNSHSQELVSRWSHSTASSQSTQRFLVFSGDFDHSSNEEMAGHEYIVIYYRREDFPEFSYRSPDHTGPPPGNWI